MRVLCHPELRHLRRGKSSWRVSGSTMHWVQNKFHKARKIYLRKKAYMQVAKKLAVFVVSSLLVVFITAKTAILPIHAASSCSFTPNPINLQSFINGVPPEFTIASDITPSWVRTILVHCQTGSWQESPRDFSFTVSQQGTIKFKMSDNRVPDVTQLQCLVTGKSAKIEVKGGEMSGSNNILCTINVPVVDSFTGTGCSISVNPNPPKGGESYSVTVKSIPLNEGFKLYFSVNHGTWVEATALTQDPQTINTSRTYDDGTKITLAVSNASDFKATAPILCSTEFIVGQQAAPDDTSGQLTVTDICTFSPGQECDDCVNGVTFPGKPGIYTPFGCIPANPQGFIENVLRIAIGIAGGIAFLMMLYAGFTMMMSSGNPEKLNSGKEIFVSAVAGLLLIIFSAVILRIIGVDILVIPGFG